MSLIQQLPSGPLDIIGDVHGEYEALCNLLQHLGYDAEGNHQDGRTLVFVGDFCDRGPDSPAVLALVERLVRSSKARAVLGNHEMNLLRGSAKDGSGWFFDERQAWDVPKYAPFQRLAAEKKEELIAFLLSLPIGLEREDLRVVHAAWVEEHIQAIRPLPVGSVIEHDNQWNEATHMRAVELKAAMREELAKHPPGLEDPHHQPPFMSAHASHDAMMQMHNPLRVLTSGVEREWHTSFYSGGKWRFVGRMPWWNEYDAHIPVVVGHYWRRYDSFDRSQVGKGDADLFEDTKPWSWHGKHGNVYCVDFSVGGRWAARKNPQFPVSNYKLAALRWPERSLQFDDGHMVLTDSFLEAKPSQPGK
ncbi:MAG: metallophosphoesterase [Undibacterium umbellatum]|uniref:metallophosphoesterase n=1 Tax=Undibacterium umbellatum TaxID=2762300 RepID=UPI003BB6A584